MKGIVGKLEHFQGLLKRHNPYESLGRVVELELGIENWEEIINPEDAMAEKHSAIHDHVAGRMGEGR